VTIDTKDTKPKRKSPAKGDAVAPKKSPKKPVKKPAKKKVPAPKGERACTAALAEQILSSIETHGISFSEACKKVKCNRPNAWHFIHTDKELDNRYARAREDRGVMFGEKVSKVADETLKGKYAPDVARVAIDAYKWTAARMASKQFGDKVDHQHAGPNGGAIPHQMVILTPGQMAGLSEEELKAILKVNEMVAASTLAAKPENE